MDIETAINEVAEQFRAIKARNVRWSLTSLPVADVMSKYGLTRDDALTLRELAFEAATPERLVDIVGSQRQGRGPDHSPRVPWNGYRDRKAIAHGAWLQDPHISASEVARLTGAHVSTARNYLAELRSNHC